LVSFFFVLANRSKPSRRQKVKPLHPQCVAAMTPAIFPVVMARSSRRAGSAAVAAAKRVRGDLPVPETVDSA
jgi:hypothetical protein